MISISGCYIARNACDRRVLLDVVILISENNVVMVE